MNYRGISIYASFYFNRKPLTTDVGENLPKRNKRTAALHEARAAAAAPAPWGEMELAGGGCEGTSRGGYSRCCLFLLFNP